MEGQGGGENASFINSDVGKPPRIRFRLKSSNIIKFRLGFATAGKGVEKTRTPKPRRCLPATAYVYTHYSLFFVQIRVALPQCSARARARTTPRYRVWVIIGNNYNPNSAGGRRH